MGIIATTEGAFTQCMSASGFDANDARAQLFVRARRALLEGTAVFYPARRERVTAGGE